MELPNHAKKFTKEKSRIVSIPAFQPRSGIAGTCPSCGFGSFQEDAGNAPILDYECIVCRARETYLMVDCPECGAQNKLIGGSWHKCNECNHEIDENDIQTFLTKDFVYDKHDPDRSIVAHCEECDGYETVVEVNGTWICSQCFTKYDSEEVGECDWCNSLSTGNLDDSYFKGCVACDGNYGWDSDKDD